MKPFETMTSSDENTRYLSQYIELVYQYTDLQKELSHRAVQFAKQYGRGFLVANAIEKETKTYKNIETLKDEFQYKTQENLKLIQTPNISILRSTYNNYDPIKEFVVCLVFEQDTVDVRFAKMPLYTPPAKHYFKGLPQQPKRTVAVLPKCACTECKSNKLADKQCKILNIF